MRSDSSQGHVITLGHSLLAMPASHSPVHLDLAKEETDIILSYYQSLSASSDVSATPVGPESRQNSIASTSTYSSEYSMESSADSLSKSSNTHPLQPRAAAPPAAARRRSSIPTQGGADRRRLAIVQVDTLGSLPEYDGKKQEPALTRSSDPGGSTNSIGSRRGLALVAPPDASPQSYSFFSPCIPHSPLASHPVSSPASSHVRSTSEAVKVPNKTFGHVPRKSSREVAIVGTANFSEAVASDLQQWAKISPAEALKPPLFQMPQSRSPSPGNSEVSDSSGSMHRGRQRKDALAPGVSPIKELAGGLSPVLKPNIGESQHISDRVAGPIVINLFPESPTSSSKPASQLSTPPQHSTPTIEFTNPFMPSLARATTTDLSSYLNYQPGLHATAGPLPPPPVAVFNINSKAPPPRPPRQSPLRRKGDREAITQSLQLPPHVTAALKTKSSSSVSGVQASGPHIPTQYPQNGSDVSSPESTDSRPVFCHVREGAFPPSRFCTLDLSNAKASSEDAAISSPQSSSMEDLVASIGLAIDDMGIMNSSDVPPPTVVEPPRNNEGDNGRRGLEIRRDSNRLGPSAEIPQVGRTPSPQSEENATDGSTREVLPPLPAKSAPLCLDARVKNVLNMKRFSALPRTPSLISLNRLSLGSKRSSRSPSVTHPNMPPASPIRRIKSAHPSAMQFLDVLGKKSSLERSIGYARKINELYNHDCGLADWMTEVRNRAGGPQSAAKRTTLNSDGLRVPSTCSPSLKQRQVSQSSTDSGVTFPRRPDAYSATDLSSRTAGDGSPPNAPPPLPYPVLASLPRNGLSRVTTTVVSSPPTRSVTSPSTSKSPVGFLTTLGRKASLKKEQAHNILSSAKIMSEPRPANIPPVVPSVPGGPRAPPNRMQRSQTIILTQNEAPHRASTAARRPSLFGSRGSTPDKQSSTMSEPDFGRQLDRLSALLPKADRNVLSVYLRRTGQDMLALGQYIEDHKSGTFRYDC